MFSYAIGYVNFFRVKLSKHVRPCLNLCITEYDKTLCLVEIGQVNCCRILSNDQGEPSKVKNLT